MSALASVQRAYEALPGRVHTDDPRTVLSRLGSGVLLAGAVPSHAQALQLAALGLALVVSVDRAEMLRVDTGAPDAA